MSKLLFFIILAAGAFALANHVGIAPSLSIPGMGSTGVVENGRDVVYTTDTMEIRFTSGPSLDDEFMVFGGQEMPRSGSITHALVSGIAGDDARAIASRFPDFHLCKSPGAASAERLIQGMNFVARNTSARDALGEALDLHVAAIRSGGERSCLKVKGASLELEQVSVLQTGEDLTPKIKGFFRDSPLYLVRDAAVVDCKSVL